MATFTGSRMATVTDFEVLGKSMAIDAIVDFVVAQEGKAVHEVMHESS